MILKVRDMVDFKDVGFDFAAGFEGLDSEGDFEGGTSRVTDFEVGSSGDFISIGLFSSVDLEGRNSEGDEDGDGRGDDNGDGDGDGTGVSLPEDISGVGGLGATCFQDAALFDMGTDFKTFSAFGFEDRLGRGEAFRNG